MVDRSSCFTAWSAVGLLLMFATTALVIAGIVGDWAGAMLAGWQVVAAGATMLSWSIKASYSKHRRMTRVNGLFVGVAVVAVVLSVLEFAFLLKWMSECPSTSETAASLCTTPEHCTERDLSCVGGGFVHLIAAAAISGMWILTSIAFGINGIGYAFETPDPTRQSKPDMTDAFPKSKHPWRFIAPAAIGTVLALATAVLIALSWVEGWAGTATSGWQVFSGGATVVAWALAMNYSQRDAMAPAQWILVVFGVFGAGFAIAELIYMAFWLNDHPSRSASAVDVCSNPDACTVRNLTYLDNGYVQMYLVAIVAGLWIAVDLFYVWAAWGYRNESVRVKKEMQKALHPSGETQAESALLSKSRMTQGYSRRLRGGPV